MAIGLLGAVAPSAHAQATWINFAGGNWSSAGNWNPSPPIFGDTASLTFSSTPLYLPPIAGLAPGGSYVTTADGATVYVVNRLAFDGFGANNVVTNTGIAVMINNAAGTVRFQGIDPRITQNGTGSIGFTAGPAGTTITLTSSGLTIDGSGSGHVAVTGNIGGDLAGSNLAIDQTGATPLFSGAQVNFIPATANTFFGGNVVLNNGNLNLSNSNNAPLGHVANTLVINGGSVRSGGSLTGANFISVANPVQLNSRLNFVGQLDGTFTGPVTGNGGVAFQPTVRFSTGGFNRTPTLSFHNAISGVGPILVESFNGKRRDELLTGEFFHTLREAKIHIESWRRHYNQVWPHSALGYKPPVPETNRPVGACFATLRRPQQASELLGAPC